MPDYAASVKAYIRQMETWRTAAQSKGDSAVASVYDRRLEFLNGIVKEVEDLRRFTKPVPASYGDLSDLPPELVKELSGIKVDDLEQQIFTIIKSADKDVDLDVVLIELYRRFEVIGTRKYLQNKLWRMAQKGLIFSVPSRKGVYTAIKPNGESASSEDLEQSKPEVAGGATATPGWDDDDVPF